MFNLFRRKPSEDAATDGQSLEEQRLFHHTRVPDAQDLTVYLSLGDEGPPVLVELLDMNIQGAGLAVPFHLAPTPDHDRIVELAVSHTQDGWRVTTPARVTRVSKLDEQRVHVGLQFMNLGDLYAQLDDALGRYFNRRASMRVLPAEGAQVGVRISYQHHRLRGFAHDVSRTGVGVRMTLVQAAIFKTGEEIRLQVELPEAKGPLEGAARVRHGYRLKEDVVLGMEFDLTKGGTLEAQRKQLYAYIEQREREILELQRRLIRRGTA